MESPESTVQDTGGDQRIIIRTSQRFLGRHQVSPKPHPLLIPEICSYVFQFLPLKDVLSCRSVCKIWKGASCFETRKKKKVLITSPECMDRYISLMEESDRREFPDAWFRIHGDDGDMPIELFMSSFGCFITVLELSTEFRASAFNLRNMFFMYMPNLEILSLPLSCCKSPHLFADGTFKTFRKLRRLCILSSAYGPMIMMRHGFLRHLLQAAAPTVERLSTYNHAQVTGTPSTDANLNAEWEAIDPLYSREVNIHKLAFYTLVGLPSYMFMPNLQILELNLELKEDQVVALTRSGFTLKHLCLAFLQDVTGESVDLLLSSMGNSLQSATLFFSHHSPAACYTYTAVLENLEFFTLFSFSGSLNYIRNFPNLKRLTVSKLDLETAFHDCFLPYPHPCMKELYIQHDPLSSASTARIITQYFPELRSLVIRRATNEVLRIIYASLPKLEELAVFDGAFTDEGISGVKNSTLKMIAPSSSMRDLDPGALRQGLPISCLQNLRKLRLEAIHLGDNAVCLGICGCKLNYVHLRTPKISDRSLRHLCRLQLDFLNVKDCPRLTETGKRNLKRKFKGRFLLIDSIEMVLAKSLVLQRILSNTTFEDSRGRLNEIGLVANDAFPATHHGTLTLNAQHVRGTGGNIFASRVRLRNGVPDVFEYPSDSIRRVPTEDNQFALAYGPPAAAARSNSVTPPPLEVIED